MRPAILDYFILGFTVFCYAIGPVLTVMIIRRSEDNQ